MLVGTPNVGKSSIVRAVSSGTPEINNYPFTTRSVTIGHIIDEEKHERLKIYLGHCTGLGKRNEMEKLTLLPSSTCPRL